MAKNASDVLIEKINEKQNPSVVGLDPRLNQLPLEITREAREQYGDTFEGAAAAIFHFNRAVIDAISNIVPMVKPQVAFYEQYGYWGIKAYQDTITYAKEKGLLVIGDCKRNDIGSTAAAYAAAHLGEVELFNSRQLSFDVDWLTVNPYLGDDGLLPFTNAAQEYGKGIFVLVKTSNPSSAQYQDLIVKQNDKMLYMAVAQGVHELALQNTGAKEYSSVGAVVGATYPEEAANCRKILTKSIFLVPGYGAQGGGAADTVPFFNSDGYGAVVNSSRGIIFAYKKDNTETKWQDCVRNAALKMKDDLYQALKDNGKLPKGW